MFGENGLNIFATINRQEAKEVISSGLFRKKGSPPISNWKVRRFFICSNGTLYYQDPKVEALTPSLVKGEIFVGDCQVMQGTNAIAMTGSKGGGILIYI